MIQRCSAHLHASAGTPKSGCTPSGGTIRRVAINFFLQLLPVARARDKVSGLVTAIVVEGPHFAPFPLIEVVDVTMITDE